MSDRISRRPRVKAPLVALLPALLLVGCAPLAPGLSAEPSAPAGAATEELPAPKGHERGGSFSFTVPGGGTCEATYFFPDHADGELLETARSVFADLDLEEIERDIDESIEAARSGEGTAVDASGAEVAAGYGTEWYPEPDVEYSSAVTDAIGTLLQHEWAAAGVDTEQPRNSTYQTSVGCDAEATD